jgi:CubicO group peptidase (beta-lactamase class C family)
MLTALLLAAGFASLDAAQARGEFPKLGSVLVAQHGKLLYERYFTGDAETLRDTRSATKSITSMLFGIARADVAQPVLPLLPERARKLKNPDPRKDRMTVEDLLTMSGPLDCDDWVDASPGNEEKMYPQKDWAQFVLDLPVRVPEERKFHYCTGGVFVLGEALQALTGKRADVYAREKLFSPLGIDKVQWVYSPLGEPQTGGGLRLRSRDLLKLAQLYLDKGRDLVPAEWVRRSTEPHARIDDKTDYGYLFWLHAFGGQPSFFMTGNGGNKVVVVPSLDAAIVITSENYNTRGMHQLTEKLLIEQILPQLAADR